MAMLHSTRPMGKPVTNIIETVFLFLLLDPGILMQSKIYQEVPLALDLL